MLIGFFLHLKSARLPVSTREFLTLLEALQARVVSLSLDDFYVLARTTLIKDETQFDRKSKYHDETATPDNPRWLHVDFRFVKKTSLISLTELRKHKPLAKMRVLAKGNRLSITPVDPDEWKFILGLMK